MLKKARQNTLVQNIVNQIEDAIVNGTFKPGDKLPSPQDLEKMVGTSRGTLREALRVLEQKGLIEIKLGIKGGTFVKEFTTEKVTEGLALLIRQRKIAIVDIAEFRKVVEAGLLELVIDKITKPDIDELKRFLLELQVCVKKGFSGWIDFLNTEVRLRKTLIRLSGSGMYEAVLVPIHDNMLPYAIRYLPARESKPSEAYRDWCQIIDAVERRDASTAKSIMRDHIARYAKLMEKVRAEFEEKQSG